MDDQDQKARSGDEDMVIPCNEDDDLCDDNDKDDDNDIDDDRLLDLHHRHQCHFRLTPDRLEKERFLENRLQPACRDSTPEMHLQNSIRQEATQILKFRMHKNLMKDVKSSLSVDFKGNQKKDEDNPEVAERADKTPDSDSSEDFEQPIDYSMKTRKRKLSELSNRDRVAGNWPEGLTELLRSREESEVLWTGNLSAVGSFYESDCVRDKDEAIVKQNGTDRWRQNIDSKSPDASGGFGQPCFQRRPFAYPLNLQIAPQRQQIGREYQERQLIGQFGHLYNAFQADLLQRIVHNHMWMMAQAKGLPLQHPRRFGSDAAHHGSPYGNLKGGIIASHNPGVLFCRPKIPPGTLAAEASKRDRNAKSNQPWQEKRFKCEERPDRPSSRKTFASKEDVAKFCEQQISNLPESDSVKVTGSFKKCSSFSKEKISTIIPVQSESAKTRLGYLGDFICQLCSERFDGSLSLANHNCSKMAKIRYECPQCDKVFNCPANLASHRRWHRPKM